MSESLVKSDVSLELLVGQVADEFLRRQQAGERPDVEEYAARYPQAAELLRKVLASLEALELSLKTASVTVAAGEASGTLGDFRILREVGRGGMGIVYEAEQISLGRHVALKVLPFAATMDPRQLTRFHNEARAAACLHHPHIVPVFGVGCERGVHYYAMQFIDGQTLATCIAQQRRRQRQDSDDVVAVMEPTTAYTRAAHGRASAGTTQAAWTTQGPTGTLYFQAVAGLGVQVAEALEHAHQLGIVHRDIKPANLLVDSGGKVWITDFGLARLPTDAGLTMTGDLLGTLRYMSPEQALAQRVVIDHRSDIYSLGVTLYELLTLEPAVSGKDRQEILRNIAFEEPHAPRSWNRSIPAELETIVLKAMEKNPANRYATAQELAEDLQRFLEDLPIRAKRLGLVGRAGKWARRHKTVVRASVLLLLLTVVGLAVSAVLIGHAYQAEVEQRHRAEENFQEALAAVDQLLTRVGEKRLIHEPGMEQIRRAVLEDALRFFQRFLSRRGADPQLRLEVGAAYRRVGRIRRQLGQHAEAEEACRLAIQFLTPLADDPTGSTSAGPELARSHLALGRTLQDIGRHAEAEPSYLRAAQGLEAAMEQSGALAQYRSDLADVWNALGVMYLSQGRTEDAERAFQQSLAGFKQLAATVADNAEYLSQIGGELNNLALLRTSSTDLPRACQLLEEAISYQRAALKKKPDDREFRAFLRNHLRTWP